MTNTHRITLLRGTTEQFAKHVPHNGELVLDTGSKQVYIGDGVTPGGILWPGFDGKDVELTRLFDANGQPYFALTLDGEPVLGKSLPEGDEVPDTSWAHKT